VPGYDPRGKARVDRNPGSTLAGNHLLYNDESDAHKVRVSAPAVYAFNALI